MRRDHRSFTQVVASPPRVCSSAAAMADQGAENRDHCLDGFGAGRAGHGAGRFDQGAGRGGVVGSRNMVWTRDIEEGSEDSTNMDHGRTRWEAAAMETRSDDSQVKWWGDNNQSKADVGNSGQCPQQDLRPQQDTRPQQDRRLQTLGRRTAPTSGWR